MFRSKLLYAVIFLIFASAGLYSQNSYLQLSLYNDEDFSVTFDNTVLSSGSYAEFENISPGEHFLRVEKTGLNVPAQADILFEGKIKIPAGSDIYAVIDEYNSFLVYKKKPFGFKRFHPAGENITRCGDENKSTKEVNEYSTNEGDCKYKVMKKDDFTDLKSSINNRNFVSSNLAVIKTALEKNYFLSEQIRDILGYLTFDSDKLDIAKLSYSRVCDVKNFFKVYEAFTFESSIDDLKNYISGK